MKKEETPKAKVNSNFSRRKFIKNSALLLGGISIVPRHVLGRGFIAPSDKINLGVIGLGKQGDILANYFLQHTEAQIVAGAEVWDSKRAFFKKRVEGFYAKHRNVGAFKGVDTYLEYKELLNRKDIDAVIIATPDHWHGIQSVDAMNAGKDVYCEKPLTNTVWEGRQIVNTVEKTKAVFQTGSMQRAWDRFIKAKELIDSGTLGSIKKVLVNVGDPGVKCDLPSEPMPKGVDWNRWCGPAPLLPYNSILAPSEVKGYPMWRKYEEIGGGILSDWGAHMFDVAQWGLDMDHSGPVEYIPPEDPAAVRGLRMIYENGVEMVHEDFGRGWGVRFIGSKGSLDVSRGYLDTNPESILGHPNDSSKYGKQNNFYEDWILAIKNRTKTLAPAQVGHQTATICNVANIAYDLQRPLRFDPLYEQFKDDKEADKLLKRQDRLY